GRVTPRNGYENFSDESVSFEINRFDGNELKKRFDEVAKEVSLSLFLNGVEIAKLHILPTEFEFLAIGFLFTERLIDLPTDVRKLSFNPNSFSIEVETFQQNPLPSLTEVVRSVTSGCGRGLSFISPAFAAGFPPLFSKKILRAAQIVSLTQKLQTVSDVFKKTGCVHSASLAISGEMAHVSEDIGRHNAVDKAIGWAFRNIWPLPEGAILLSTGRVSTEIVIKAHRGGICFIVSHSAPTYAAVQLADSLGITVIGFARGNRFNVYTHQERVAL
ncbi:formate dehydrogenase accessory sulfurtransferase FdhD, partial [bacterium]|nr:formate dehydrogenase accessory sulfurtransferase FdhD [bacterium]